MLFEFDPFVRRIYTDGRPHDKDAGALWMGDSIGRWEGDTLVADTVSFNEKTTLDREGYPHSDAMHLVERIRRVDHDCLVVDLTVDDPRYTKPWGAKLNLSVKAGLENHGARLRRQFQLPQFQQEGHSPPQNRQSRLRVGNIPK